MSAAPAPLAKTPVLDPAQDFYRLRREGVELIEEAGSANWTDYNVHDPGITILEALCYAITDLGYRFDWNIADILAPQTPSANAAQPFPNQAFFTARNILTVNPYTPDDFRKLLIDLDGVRDAWIVCKTCACEASYFAWCDKNNALALDYTPPADPTLTAREVWAKGLYEVLLELDDDPQYGDLNDRMISYSYSYHDSDGAHPVTMELRFPDISMLDRDQWQSFLANDAAFADPAKFTITLTRLGATKDFNALTPQPNFDPDAYIHDNWMNIFYLSLEIEIVSSGTKIEIGNAALRVFGDTAVRNAAMLAGWRTLFQDKGAAGFVRRYRNKAKAAAAAVRSAKTALQTHRNLDEDYCLVGAVGIEEVAVCADVEVQPDADIELVQARIWFEIENYFSPPVPFHTLQELRDAGEAVEDIFDGPELDNGFILADDLATASFKSVLRVSDIINRLMAIEGVIAVNQMRLTKYDSEGNAIYGAADPAWSAQGQPVFDPNKLSASWLLYIGSRHQPRLYLNQSRFLFYKNGLPFLPRMDEATDTLNALLGEADRPKNPDTPNDLPIPAGTFRNPQDYYPVQNSLPLTYGVGPVGLPTNASPRRRAQARDLKAYLMVFEQLLGNALAQLAHTADLFALDSSILRTYFVEAFDQTIITGFNDIVSGMTTGAVEAMIETVPQFQERRNRFLDHLLARFGEQFSEYALLLTDAAGEKVAQPRLIENKIAFLKRYPAVSHDRAKAFDYTHAPCAPDNYPGLKKRIGLLLGQPDLGFSWTVGNPGGGNYPVGFVLADANGAHWLEGTLTVAAANAEDAKQTAWRTLIERMIVSDAYAISASGSKFLLVLQDASANELGRHVALFNSKDKASALADELLTWAALERMIVVEHLLLRPKFIGDARYPACCDGGCVLCGNEDPYSFRLTFVMPGWTEEFTDDLDLRGFAQRTIQQETPSHLLGKTCWVGNDGFVENPCDEIVDTLADLLQSRGLTAGGTPPNDADACNCAKAIYHAFGQVFSAWFEDKKYAFLHKDALQTLIGALFQGSPKSGDVSCTTVLDAALWKIVQDTMTAHFVDIALNGWQFERFEWAWCQWLDANAAIDWTEERLVERVEAILAANVTTAGVKTADLCQCARRIVTDCGTKFYAWMTANIAQGTAPDALAAFVAGPVTLCEGMNFKAGTADTILALLNERYGAYTPVSYWLWAVVSLLGNLRNTYPGATLHDCDDGGDVNPVRLDSTALGNYPLRTTINT